MIANLAKLYKNDDSIQELLEKYDRKTYYTKCIEASVEPLKEDDNPCFIDFDGELMGKIPLKIELIPGAINLLAPAKFPSFKER